LRTSWLKSRFPFRRAFGWHLSAFIVLTLSAWFCFPFTTVAQNPYRVAGDHYHLLFENEWVRATRVTYAPGEKAPAHDHPKASALIYVYVTDAGIMHFQHFRGDSPSHVADRPPVKAGSLRLASGSEEVHSVEYLGNVPSEYITLELRTGAPFEYVKRLPPIWLDPGQSKAEVQYENAQLRVVRVSCVAGERCPDSIHPDDKAIVVVLTGPQKGDVKWSPERMEGPMQQIRFELKATGNGRGKPLN
jgi:quercetin dioxygenase-like cupin family protein